MDFAALPPEVNSGRMYVGPGSGPMLAAAAAWDGLAADLHSSAAAYGSVISGLTGGSWLGRASASMAAAAAPYVAWMSATAAQAEQTGAQARAAASAYEAAFAMTVPPPVIAANRAQLAALVATNFLGQNIPAIMATEAHYGEMWAQDAAAMYGYAGTSATASTLTPFTPPKPTTNPGGPNAQAAAAAQAAGTHAQTALSSMSAVPQALQSLASPTSTSSGLSPLVMGNGASLASSGASTPASMLTGLTGASGLATPNNAGTLGIVEDTAGLGLDGVGLAGLEAPGLVIEALGGPVSEATGAAGLGPLGVLGPLGGMGGGLGGLPDFGGFGGLGAAGASASIGGLGAAGASASIGQAASLGALSVPQSWSPLPAIRPVAMELPLTSLSAAPEVLTGTSGNMFSETALAGMAGRAMGGTATLGRRERTEPSQSPPGSVAELRQLTELLRELAALRDSGILTDEEFNKQKRRLLGH